MTPDMDRLAYWLLKDVNKAIRDYNMITAGDRVAVALSGGKDSLSLLRLLDFRRENVKEDYELFAIHVMGDARGPQQAPHQPLLSWLGASGYQYKTVPLDLPPDEPLPLTCHRCTWNRRRTLFQAAQGLGCNVVAYGHHADDLSQTTLLNLLFHARVETMAPKRDYFDGTFQLVRPLAYLPESEIKRFAKESDFPPPPPACPQSRDSRRQFIADLIRQAETDCHDVRTNLLRAGLAGLEWETGEGKMGLARHD
jgi:tRNA 2-thiocytidine biosynthesis protein TtcA